MKMALNARQIGLIRPLPISIRYYIPRDRMQADDAFAKAIRAKYTDAEGLDLPSASFVFPEMALIAAETRDQIAESLLTLNRISVRMNISSNYWLRQFALSVENRCELLLKQLSVLNRGASGAVPAASVRELEQVFRTLTERIEHIGSPSEPGLSAAARPRQDVPGPETDKERSAAAQEQVLRKEEEETVFRILLAAARGIGSREQYLSDMHRRLYESRARRDGSDEAVLQRAGTELLRLGTGASAGGGAASAAGAAAAGMSGTLPLLTGWSSERARQFFWQVQRAPEEERAFILEAGGIGSLISLERELRVMNDTQFERFSTVFLERLAGAAAQEETPEDRRADRQLLDALPDEEWAEFTAGLEQAGFVFREETLTEPPAGERAQSPAEPPSAEPEGAMPRRKQAAPALLREKQIFLERLEAQDGTAQTLRRFLITAARRAERRARNAETAEALSEDIRNMTLSDWENFRTELQHLSDAEGSASAVVAALARITGREAPAGPAAAREAAASENTDAAGRSGPNGYTSAGAIGIAAAGAAADTDGAGADYAGASGAELVHAEDAGSALAARGIRMTREKQEMIRQINLLSRSTEERFTDLVRVLHETAILRESAGDSPAAAPMRSRSREEKERQLSLLKEVLQPEETLLLTPEKVFLRIARNGTGSLFGAAAEEETLPGASSGAADGRAAALSLLARLREGRVEEPAQPAFRQEEMSFSSPDLEIPARRETGEAAASPSRASRTRTSTQEIGIQDIEFITETGRNVVRTEQQTVSDLKELMSRVERQQQEIEQIRRSQNKIASKDFPGEVMKRLEDGIRMEQLRGGR